MNCPACNIKLSLTERFGDYCPECGGLWIEKGNFDKINDRTFIEISTNEILPNRDCHHGRRDDRCQEKSYEEHCVSHQKKRGFVH